MNLLRKEYSSCVLEVEDTGVATLTLTDAKRMNAFNEENLRNILAATILLRQTPEAQVLILTGTDYVFSSGGDISLLADIDSVAKAQWTFEASCDAVNLIYDLEIPVIAAVNGIVAGAALPMMMACDLIIGSENAVLFFAFRQIGFTSDSGTSHFLVHKLGYHKAAEILFFGRKIDAKQAEELGLFNRVVPAGELLTEARKWAERIASGPMLAMAYDKKLLRAALHNNFYQQQELESHYQIFAWASRDFQEGVAAFNERRKPQFKDKFVKEYRG
ncbi:MAG TPA: enoyl-CoA hydratase/isomerase family protein [Gelria sp.]|jgi:2-(1,2-epoxy-1,2-dihydrophenyl)acetyl-CoA isomerase|nr:enoyl-CoA hydratase/isomerase family protein [Gelria sp.]